MTNDYGQITLDLSTEWRAYHRPGAPELYPEVAREEIDEIAQLIFNDVNNGVYRCGFAGSQRAYDLAFRRLFDRLDWLSEHLRNKRYLVGDTITEADVRCSRLLSASMPSITGTSSATGRNWPRCPCCGPMPGTCSRPLALATPSTLTT